MVMHSSAGVEVVCVCRHTHRSGDHRETVGLSHEDALNGRHLRHSRYAVQHFNAVSGGGVVPNSVALAPLREASAAAADACAAASAPGSGGRGAAASTRAGRVSLSSFFEAAPAVVVEWAADGSLRSVASDAGFARCLAPPFVVITGTNMGGKSSLLRAVGLSVLLAHVGGPVPAAAAEIQGSAS